MKWAFRFPQVGLRCHAGPAAGLSGEGKAVLQEEDICVLPCMNVRMT